MYLENRDGKTRADRLFPEELDHHGKSTTRFGIPGLSAMADEGLGHPHLGSGYGCRDQGNQPQILAS